MPEPTLVEKIASGEERPCIQMTAPDMLKHAKANWDNAFCLYQLVAESRIRIAKNPTSNAVSVLAEISPRFEELVGVTFPDDPNPEPGSNDFVDANNWPKVGLLKYMGYTTGSDDPGTAARQRILRRCFSGPVPNVHDKDYMRSWGRNGTPRRLSKMAWSLASFAANRMRMNGGAVDSATRLWKRDLAWLRTEFYEGHFGFPWPRLD